MTAPRSMTPDEVICWAYLDALEAGVKERKWEEGQLLVNRLREAFRRAVDARLGKPYPSDADFANGPSK